MSTPVIVPMDGAHDWIRFGLAEPLSFCARCPARKLERQSGPVFSRGTEDLDSVWSTREPPCSGATLVQAQEAA